ncbi:MAG: membrane-bound serine protease (ClpP class) [Moritella sp.]|jgi:membrane-bound serine protease (ClpP class)
MFSWFISIMLLFSSILYAETVDPAYSITDTAEISVPVLEIKGAIGPAVSHYLIKEINQANSTDHVPMVIITIDTPGGLVSSLRDINQVILNSNIPIACLVHPQGARAASAGTYILYACHVAAMATATTLGAATPVSIGNPLPTEKKPAEQDDEPESPPSQSAMEKKVLNDSIAYIRSLAQLRGRNVEWAELAVKEAATLTATEALDKNVIDLIVDSPQQLISKLDGQQITVKKQQQLLTLTNARLDYHQPDWRSNFIGTITNPNIAYILMLIGIYGILLEFYSPGIGIAGISGGISLFIALYAFQLLPLDYAGLGLLLLGIALLVTESMNPSFGIFGLGGIIAFVLGSIFLFDSDLPQFQISLQLIAAVAVTSLLLFIFVFSYLWNIRKNKVVSGKEAMVGSEVTIDDDFSGQGYVEFKGERWAACSELPLSVGQTAYVTDVDGLNLILSPVTKAEPPDGSNH